MKSLKSRSASVCLAAVLLSFFGFSVQASAASSTSKPLKISPVRTELTIKPGETAKVSTFITNVTAQPATYKIVENDFVAGDEKGTASLILDENSYAPTHSLKRFMVPVPNISVAPGATQQVDVSIKVPANAQAGGYFGAVRFIPVSTDGGGNLGVNASAASLVLMTVPGALVEHLDLTNFDVRQNGGVSTNFRSPDNLELLLRFKNDGNVQGAPFGQINVLKGKKKVYSYNFNDSDTKDNILPDSARKWTVPLKNIGKFGKYTITGNFTYGTTNQTVEVKKTIWIVPTTYIFIGVGAVLLVLFIIFLIVSLIRAKRGASRKSRRYY